MLLYLNIYLSIFYSIVIIFFNFYVFKKISKYLVIDFNVAKIIFFNHLIFTTIYFFNDFFSLFNFTPGSDALSFYFNSDQKILFENLPFYPGHNFLFYITFYLKKIYLDFISLNLLFGFLGSLSILIFYGSVSKYFTNNFDKYALIIFVLLPSYNFWTSGISKDVLTALSLSLMLLSFTKNDIKFLLFSIILLFFVRVHLSLLVIISFFTSIFLFFIYVMIFKNKIYLFNCKLEKKYLLILFLASSILSSLIIKEFFYTNFFNLVDTIKHFQTMYLGHNFIESQFFPLRILEYLARPYLWEENNFLIKIMSLENILIIILLLFFVTTAVKEFNKKIKFRKQDLKLFLLLSFILIFIFQVTLTSNVGIAMRQKWTFLPGLVFIFIYCKFCFISNKFEKIKSKKTNRID